jgi:hypothetical protein
MAAEFESNLNSEMTFYVPAVERCGSGCMVSSPFDTYRQPIAIDFSDRPTLALAYALSGWLMDFLGPMFWAVLIVGFLYAEIFTR